MTEGDRAVLDRSTLLALAEDIGQEATDELVARFLAMLDERLARIRRASDTDELQVAVLSLACSAAMLGADALAEAARDLPPPDGVPSRAGRTSRGPALARLDDLARRSADELDTRSVRCVC
ncbi:hypothetical protein [Georgenia sp. Z1491]|uniref:hypothetical protein n=1 Tax=Georgenia sp. Z1491 TaxID=3416707 RepID=UPI003CED40F4